MRILTILVRFGTEQYSHAERGIDDLFRRRMPAIERTVVVVDNALPTGLLEESGSRTLIGGDNRAGEFSGFDRALAVVGSDIWRYDYVHFATSAFDTLYVDYLERFDAALLESRAHRPVCLGHIDCYNEAVQILGFRTQHWIRTCFFFLPPAEAKALGTFVSVPDGQLCFSGDPASPFRSDAPLDERYQQYILTWLTGGDIGQGVEWHSRFALTADTLQLFERKALAIMNEHLLAVRLRALHCQLIDAMWLATMLVRHPTSAIAWNADWREQLTNRDRDRVLVS
jgi:hypothetical protein